MALVYSLVIVALLAEIYLRPRSALWPTHAFRIESWQTSLDTGRIEVAEVEPPAEVVR